MDQEQGKVWTKPQDDNAKEDLPSLLFEYRRLKDEAAVIQNKMDEYKRQIQPLVELQINGVFKDDLGYAKMMTRKASVTYKSSSVDDLVQSWLISGESLIRTCGDMLNVLRAERKATTYLQIK